MIAIDLWDADSWHELVSRQVRPARDAGALVRLEFALNFLARSRLATGELTDVAVLARDRAGDGAGRRWGTRRCC
jgi:hypothetical protein